MDGITFRGSMDSVTVRLESDSSFRPTEIMGDLRMVAETLYFPMKLVGFWDETAGGNHMCPEVEIGRECPHGLAENDPGYVPYTRSMERLKQAVIEVRFPHASVRMFLS